MGALIGYGAIHRAARPMRIAVLAAGYADGKGGTPGLGNVSVNSLTDANSGGCSCTYASAGGTTESTWLLLLGATLFCARRRRRPAR